MQKVRHALVALRFRYATRRYSMNLDGDLLRTILFQVEVIAH